MQPRLTWINLLEATLTLCILGMLIVLFGCATHQPSPDTVAWYNATTQQMVDEVVNVCIATHSNYAAQKSPVDCQVVVPSNLTMSFPDTAFYEANAGNVGEYLFAWCNDVSARYDFYSFFLITLREEKVVRRGSCSELLNRSK